MCTLTIWRESEHLTVTMNRDDAYSRPESPPVLQRNTIGDFISPHDVQAGGAWIAANDAALIACLLNRYDPAPTGRRTRGDIVLRAMDVTSAAAAASALSPSAGDYSPFTCLLVDREQSIRVDWNGVDIKREALPLKRLEMLTSSSWAEHEVRAKRGDVIARLAAQSKQLGDAINAFHCHTEAGGDAWTPMMQRPTSHTKSITRVRASPAKIEMTYWRRDTIAARGFLNPEIALAMPLRELC